MYAALSLKRLSAIIAAPFAIILFLLFALKGTALDTSGYLSVAKSALAYTGIFLAVIFGPSAWWAPWRVIWHVFPILNRRVFPDLNGEWTGTTSSNWPSIQAMLDAAEGPGGLNRDTLSTVPLQADGISLKITASLFALRISAELQRTGSTSHSLTERVTIDQRRNVHELYYVYRQDTPQPVMTDEDSHLGAAMLTIDCSAWTLKGSYWTKRSWRSGLNTAGLIQVTRQSR